MRMVTFDCPSCGATLNSDLDRRKVFCSYCGREIIFDDEFQRVVLDSQNIKDLADEINKGAVDMQNKGADDDLITTVRKIRDNLDQYRELQANVEQKQSKLNDQLSLRKKIASPLSKIIPWAVFALLIFILVQMVRYSTVFILLRLLIFILGLAISFITGRVINFAMNNSAIELEEKIDELSSELEQDKSKLSKLHEDEQFGLIPEKYLYSDAVEYIFDMLVSKRALSIQQAINAYEEKLHNDKLEEMRREELRLHAQQLDELRDIKDQNERMMEENSKKGKVTLGDAVKIGGAVAIGGAIAKKIKDDLL